ncbi:MAG: hypothetical protein NW226_20685 [Microscillaceae bacterium]|nr:hypothetical protein [Microscillaceae bacterium]
MPGLGDVEVFLFFWVAVGGLQGGLGYGDGLGLLEGDSQVAEVVGVEVFVGVLSPSGDSGR